MEEYYKLNAYLREKGCTLRVTVASGADSEAVTRDLLLIMKALEKGEYKDITKEIP